MCVCVCDRERACERVREMQNDLEEFYAIMRCMFDSVYIFFRLELHGQSASPKRGRGRERENARE